MSALPKRLAITLAAPLLLLAGQHYALLPGMGDRDLAGADPRAFSVFALGVTPILTAYWLVEIVAFLVSRWSRLRHVPNGRVKLDRAARVLALVLAAFQAFGIYQQMKALAAADGASYPSMGAVVVSLVGGVCVLYVAAQIVTRRGLVNGLVLLTAVGVTPDLTALFRRYAAPPLVETRSSPLVAVLVAVAVTVFACWILLGRPSGPPPPSSTLEAPAGDSVYRGAQTLVLHPWVPLPAGSLQPIAGAFALLSLPSLLAATGLVPRAAATLVETTDTFFPVLLVLSGVLVWIAARLMNRPRELADLARRLGANPGDVPRALGAALPPTFLFIVAIVLAGPVTKLSFMTIPVLVAVVLDLAHAIAIATKRPSFVVVWEERRASAVPVLRAALAADGIATEVRGLSFLSLFQVFVPYAPAEILVAEADAPHATKALRHWLEGEKAPERVPPDGQELSFLDAAPPWPARRRNAALAGAVVAVGSVLAIVNSGLGKPKAAPKETHTLELVRVDDTVNVFDALDDRSLPPGVEIRNRNEPVGPHETARTDFAKLTLGPNEPIASGREHMRTFLQTLASQLPPGARFAIEDATEYDEDTGASRVIGVEALVVTGAPILRNADVAEAAAAMDATNGSPYVAVTLTPDAAQRFADATGEWRERRIAIVVDGVVQSAPVVKTRIEGGRLSITMGAGDPERHLAEAKSLANTLTP